MVDMVVHRHQLRATIARLCRLLMKAPASVTPPTLPRKRGRDREGAQPAGARRRHVSDRSANAAPIDAMLARLLALHPKCIDLGLDRINACSPRSIIRSGGCRR